jgi:serine protease inhibitor
MLTVAVTAALSSTDVFQRFAMAAFRVERFQANETHFALAAANSKFALTLYRHLANSTTGNMLMSPLSISVAMAMTHLGARNNTKKQMNDVMHFGEINEPKLHQAFSDIRQALNGTDQTYKLLLANKLFGEKNFVCP